MTDPRKRPASPSPDRNPPASPKPPARNDDDFERAIGRAVSVGIPVVTVLAAVAVGVAAGIGSAILVVASGTLLSAIGLLWTSVRTLSGDAPLATDFEVLAARRHGVDALLERKTELLHTLRDLESEHELGKMDDADYAMLVARFRDEAKSVMRQMDVEVAPLREQAERVAGDYLKRQGLGPQGDGAPVAAGGATADEPRSPAMETADATANKSERATCGACGISNEVDASFCKQCGALMKSPSDARA
jgi:hypothetical protein